MRTWSGNSCLAVLLTTLSGIAGADEAVKGGFGIQLGEQISRDDPRIKGDEESSPDAGLRLSFEPDHPFGALEHYHVRVTPEGRKIYRVTAEGSFQSSAACQGELAALQEALEERYGVTNENIVDSVLSSATGMEVIRFGRPPQRIVAACIGFMGSHDLTLSYIDDDLEKRAKAERARMGEGEYGGEGL